MDHQMLSKLNLNLDAADIHDRIIWRVKQIGGHLDKLDTWQFDFIRSLNLRIKQGQKVFSKAQIKVVLNIWTNGHSEGWLDLPEGKF